MILKLRKNNRPALSGILYKSRVMKIFLLRDGTVSGSSFNTAALTASGNKAVKGSDPREHVKTTADF